MKVTVRQATAEDHLLYLRLLPELRVDDPPPDTAKWAGELAANTLIAERGGESVGACTFVRLEGNGHVRALMVDPKARRFGVGRTLLVAVAEKLRAGGCSKWTLNVKPENTAAISLYVALGFRRDFSAVALRLAWPLVEQLPFSKPVQSRRVTPADDQAIEQLFSLSPGQLAGLRRSNRILLTLVDEAGVAALSAYDPTYPGAFPFRVKEPGLARALLEAMRPHALPGAEWTGVVVENDDALVKVLRDLGAEVRMNIDHYTGLL